MPTNPAKVRAGQARAKQFTAESQSAAAQQLVQKRGPDYMREIGKRGAKTFYRKYKWSPIGTSGWAIVSKKNGAVVKTVNALPGRIAANYQDNDHAA